MHALDRADAQGETIRVRGIVQGVGFRPTVYQLAQAHGIRGAVWNDAQGVVIEAWGSGAARDAFVVALRTEAPPLARVHAIERVALTRDEAPEDFRILASRTGAAHTGIAPDAATCPACLLEVNDPGNRRYRYAFTNCTHCGPRVSIVRAIPYDRPNTSMASFAQCPACQREYEDPTNRRFHAQPNACPVCGPQLWLEDASGRRLCAEAGDDLIDQAAALIRQGRILAIKGMGGIHLACDASNAAVVRELRARKRRYHKAFALMARDIDMLRRYARVEPQEEVLLNGSAAPIVVLQASGAALAPDVAPGQVTLGFMLPYTPLHHLLMQALDAPIVLTSGNRSDEPQCIDNDDARSRLTGIADFWLLHDREIVNRLDDSVVRFSAGEPRLLRRARGYAPAPISLPAGFEAAAPLLAMGAELKNSFCLVRDGEAILSQHIGDLEEAHTLHDYRHHLSLYRDLFEQDPQSIVIDPHPDYFSTRHGRELARERQLPLIEVQHHHAHIASCMAEHGLPLDSPAVLGIALDGLGFGLGGALWGGEFLRVDYRKFERLARFAPVPMPGGAQAMREPWRNTYAHLQQGLGWHGIATRYPNLEIVEFIKQKPLSTLEAMVTRNINSPPASSAGRLFDAVGAALGLCRETASHEGQAAIELEALASTRFAQEATCAYPVAWQERDGLRTADWSPLWSSLLEDLAAGIPSAVIAARFHWGLAEAVGNCAVDLCQRGKFAYVVLGGGVFQNRLLLEAVVERLSQAGLEVLAPRRVPANDAGLALGQAAVGAARSLQSA